MPPQLALGAGRGVWWTAPRSASATYPTRLLPLPHRIPTPLPRLLPPFHSAAISLRPAQLGRTSFPPCRTRRDRGPAHTLPILGTAAKFFRVSCTANGEGLLVPLPFVFPQRTDPHAATCTSRRPSPPPAGVDRLAAHRRQGCNVTVLNTYTERGRTGRRKTHLREKRREEDGCACAASERAWHPQQATLMILPALLPPILLPPLSPASRSCSCCGCRRPAAI